LWPGVEAYPLLDYINDHGEWQTPITSCLRHGDYVLVMKATGNPSAFLTVGGVPNEDMEVQELGVINGCHAPKSLVMGGSDFPRPLWISRDGIYYLNGIKEEPLGKRRSSLGFYNMFAPIFSYEVNKAIIYRACQIYYEGNLYVSLPGLDSDRNSFTLKINLDGGHYVRWDFGVECFAVDLDGNLLAGMYDGTIRQLEVDRPVESIKMKYETGMIGLNGKNIELTEITITTNTRGRDLIINIKDIAGNILKSVTINTPKIYDVYKILNKTLFPVSTTPKSYISLEFNWAGQEGDYPLEILSPVIVKHNSR